jgi:DNA replication protein DnaC
VARSRTSADSPRIDELLAGAPADLVAPPQGKTAPCYRCSERQAPVAVVGGVRYRGLCPKCEDEVEAEDAEREYAEIRAGLEKRAGFPALHKEWTLDTYLAGLTGHDLGEAGRSLSRAREWLADYRSEGRSNLLLYGPVGGGKTGLAVGVAKELIAELVPVRFIVLREFLHDMVERISQGLPAGDPALYEVAVLVLDDLGAERPTDYARNELAVLVERRYQAQLPIIVTSNYEPGELAGRIGHDDPIVGERIVSRLADGALQRRIAVKDRRR